MKQLFTLLLLCITFSSCKKQYIDPSGFTYCRFSLYNENKEVQREYYLRDGKLYDHNPQNSRPAMSEEQYQKAEKVMNEIPSVLTKDPDITYSCYCNSFEKVVLSYYEVDREYKYQIDLDSKNNPRKVQLFAEKVHKLIEELEP